MPSYDGEESILLQDSPEKETGQIVVSFFVLLFLHVRFWLDYQNWPAFYIFDESGRSSLFQVAFEHEHRTSAPVTAALSFLGSLRKHKQCRIANARFIAQVVFFVAMSTPFQSSQSTRFEIANLAPRMMWLIQLITNCEFTTSSSLLCHLTGQFDLFMSQ